MSKFLVIFKREYAQVVKKKSFIIGIVLTPLLMLAFSVVPTLLATKKSSETELLAVIDRSNHEIGADFSKALEYYKLEDDSTAYYGVQSVFKAGTDEEERYQIVYDSLVECINTQQIKYFVVIGDEAQNADSVSFMVTNADNFRANRRFGTCLSAVLSGIRLEESAVNLEVDSVLALTRHIDLMQKDAKGDAIPFKVKYFSALMFVGIMFGMIFGFGQLVMRSVIEEKNSRIMEVLVSSVSPFQLMLGKVLGLGAATFTQVSVWFLLGVGLYFMKGSLEIDPSIDRILFNPAIAVFFVLFLISGYLLFSTMFALIGSICNTEKEAQNFIMPITMVMILPFMLGIYVIQNPNSAASVVLSLIPFLTPTMMLMRVVFIAPTLSEYSLFSGIVGEATLGFILLCLSVLGLIWLTSKVFRVGILMYGKRPTLPEILKWVRQ
ncbi:MAG: ABC transporter permease [candidate division Zixibacteria bacterium]|nr:ABC transporter permease [candidate division Zixibacteria bacterium]